MSSKSSKHRRQDRQRDLSEPESESDGDSRGAKRHHHHRRDKHERRDRHRSRSRSRSPEHHRTTKPEKHSSRNHKERNHSREDIHKPLKHRDQGNGDKRRERHQEEKIKEDKDEHREKHRRRDGDHESGRSNKSKNGNHKDKEELPPLRGKWDNDPGAESDDTQERASRTNHGAAQQTSQIRIKQESDLNDARRTQDAKRKPQNPFESQSIAAGPEAEDESGPPPEKEKPNFGVSGKLTEDSNTYRGVVIKYNEPPEARKPKRKWRFYVFKGDEELPVVHIHRQSAYLLGRERLIADLPIDHPSCSKQHAVLQYRLVEFQRPDGTMGKRVRPYIIDLESSNGTYINNNRIEGKRYYELKEKDVVKFGYSTREYVLLHDKSKDSELDEEQAE
ncbi:smad nuclear-interacting protein 1-like [Asterias rubens]|uniref:smad nuclear-interacting protein 1-like n=1 Tax=Asterias rubens TaxID=7604 RepID=UPI00145528C2|nr:smad nuclear-interacting protein 1-like [Asterias rubens]